MTRWKGYTKETKIFIYTGCWEGLLQELHDRAELTSAGERLKSQI